MKVYCFVISGKVEGCFRTYQKAIAFARDYIGPQGRDFGHYIQEMEV